MSVRLANAGSREPRSLRGLGQRPKKANRTNPRKRRPSNVKGCVRFVFDVWLLQQKARHISKKQKRMKRQSTYQKMNCFSALVCASVRVACMPCKTAREKDHVCENIHIAYSERSSTLGAVGAIIQRALLRPSPSSPRLRRSAGCSW